MGGSVRRADGQGDYIRFGVTDGRVEAWEDGRREATSPGCFEWWYFEVVVKDKSANDGTVIVVAFLTKPMEGTAGALVPTISAKVRRPMDKVTLGATEPVDPSDYSAATARCDVKMGSSRCTVLPDGRYQIEFAVTDVSGTMVISPLPMAPVTRIGTGHLLFAPPTPENYFGWLVPIPFGHAAVDCVVAGQPLKGTGFGYHDHNWGNAPLADLVHHWYWGRAFVGGYVIIAANVSPQAAHGALDHTDIVLIKDGAFIARGHRGSRFEPRNYQADPDTLKPLARELTFTFEAGDTMYLATFAWIETRLAIHLGDAAYHRCLAAVTLQVIAPSGTTTLGPERATYEMMWFGDEPAANGLDLYTDCFTVPNPI